MSLKVAMYGLRWAALSQESGLLYQIQPELVAELGEVVPVRPEDLPAGLRHEPTRRLLTTLGLPNGNQLRGNQERPLTTLRQGSPWLAEGENSRTYQLDQLCLGETVYDCQIVVDGATGSLEVTEGDGEEDWPAAQLHADLSAYYLSIWTVDRLREEARRWTGLRKPADWQIFGPYRFLAKAAGDLLAEIDPSAVEDEGSLWNSLADDDHMGGLLG